MGTEYLLFFECLCVVLVCNAGFAYYAVSVGSLVISVAACTDSWIRCLFFLLMSSILLPQAGGSTRFGRLVHYRDPFLLRTRVN